MNDRTEHMLKNVLDNIEESAAKQQDINSFETQSANCTQELLRRHRRPLCLPDYMRGHLSQIRHVVANFVNTWSLPFGQKK